MRYPTGVWFAIEDEGDAFDLTGAGGPVAIPTDMGTFQGGEMLEDESYVQVSDQGYIVIGRAPTHGDHYLDAFIVPPPNLTTGG